MNRRWNYNYLPLGNSNQVKFKFKGCCSNDEAEYEALIIGLSILLNLGATRVKINGDSELVVRKLTKEYKFINDNLVTYFVKANSY